ncbi:hypothetical protein [Burkholderia multivorans]|uniref:hypothetical protein n=1 Tax=Burkholderia multivorans TaxID=87883 RepID=UPI0019D2A719|nr:hypothetical protein [Burkholderia multivorans]MBN6736239.1 hypothetical protein [Burkholderia multivorans]QSL23676.1 hypothetical protein G0D92_14630 [Burkholderia multivorans]
MKTLSRPLRRPSPRIFGDIEKIDTPAYKNRTILTRCARLTSVQHGFDRRTDAGEPANLEEHTV